MTSLSLSGWLHLAGDALRLRAEAFEYLASGRPSLRRAVYIVVIVGLLVGILPALFGLPALISGSTFDIDATMSQFDQQFEQMQMFQQFGGEMDPDVEEFMEIYRGSIEAFLPFISQMEEVPAPLPNFFGRFFIWLGIWLSSPFALLAKWLGLSIWIMLFARLLGGRGTLLSYLSASSLSTIPHLLLALNFIPCVGSVLGLIAGIWGLAIQVKAVEVTHDLSTGRAILATLLLYLLILLLIALLLFATIIIILFANIG